MSFLSVVTRGHYRFIALYCVLLSCYGAEPTRTPDVALTAHALDPAPSSVETLFGSALAEYWDARSGVTSSNGRVATWAGLKSGTLLNAPINSVNQPVLGADGSNFAGVPVVQTSASNGAFLSGQLSPTLLASGARPYIAVVHRSHTLSQAAGRVIDVTSANQATRISLYGEDASARSFFCPDWPNGGCQYRLGTGDQSVLPVISELWADTDGLHFAQDGKEESPSSGNAATQPLVRALERVVLGGLPDGSQLSDTSFAQVVITASVPSTQQRAAYREYARDAWGLNRCGDGFLGASEACDDGNSNDSDSCSNLCTLTAPLTSTPGQFLGSGVVEWWDARVGVGSLAGGVTAWRGQANGTLLQTETQDPVRRPAYSAEPGFFRQRPVIQSSTQNNAYLRGALASNLLPLGSRPYIAIIHRSRTLSTSPSAAIDARSADTATRLVLFSEDSSARGLYCPDWPDLACQHYLDTDNDGTASVLTELWVDADGAHYAENGRESSITSAAATQALVQAIEHISVGALGSNDQVSNSTFAQIVLASAPPSAAQRAQYLQYACDEWGISACGSATEDTTPTAVKAVFGSVLAEYWDARTGVFTSNGKVVSWTGLKNGSVLNAPSNPANQPSFGSDGSDFGGASVVQSSIASGAYLSGQLSTGILAAGSRPYIAVVSRSRNLAQGPSRVVDATSDSQVTRLNLGTEQASTRAMYCPDWPNGGCQYQNGTNDQVTRPVVSELWVDTDGLHVAYDGREETLLSGNVASQALVRAIERVVLGALPDGSQLSDSSYAQVVVTSSLPTATQRAEYRTYAMSAWAMHRCGDGFLGANEQCDDGNTNDADSCSNACAVNAPLATTPDQVLGSSVVEWWDARTGLGTLGGGVTTWRGQRNGTSLNPGMSDPASRPAYVADPGYFHERPIVQSSIQNNAFLTGVLNSSLLPLNSRPYIALIHRSRALSTTTERVADIASPNGATTRLSLHTEQGAARGFYCPDWPTLACQYYNNSDNQTTSAVLTELWVDTDGTHYAENGREVTASTPAANQALLRSIEQVSLGALGANSQVSNNDFAQIVLASAPPTQAQRAEYLLYACAEWGLTRCSLDGFPATGTTCNPAQSNCGFGRECRNGVGVRFGKNASEYVCWDVGCDDYQSGIFECGSTTSRCGTCPACTANCAGKNCGSDGCWGSCGNECSAGQRGCASSADCAAGLVCMPSSAGANECLPEACGHPGLNPCSDPANAGQQTICGQCLACEAECVGRDCGPAANGCGDCGNSTLGEDEFCTYSGHIEPRALANIALPPLPPDEPLPSECPTTVGTMPGTFAVSDFGQASYQMPLQVPPGRNGIEPKLALVYNSAEGDGYLGTGWALTGLSAIHRCLKTIAQDGVAAPITYTDADRFCLDGNRLVQANDNQPYGAPGTMYRTELDTFSRVELIRSASSPEPERFEVRTADGKILSYDLRVGGRDPNANAYAGWDSPVNVGSVRAHTWLLTTVRDRFGNTMRITYSAPAAPIDGSTFSQQPELTPPSEALAQLANQLVREYYPSRIEYTSNGETEADRSIDFGYRLRPDVVSGYNSGVRFERSRLLQSIVARVQGVPMFTYTLRYDENNENGSDAHTRSRLTSVEPRARATMDDKHTLACMPKTRFEYTAVVSGFEPGVTNGLTHRPNSAFLGKPLVLDMDGDGTDDVLVAMCPENSPGCGDPHWYIKRTGKEFVDTTHARRVTSGDVHVPAKAFVVDYDLDGKDDLVEIYASSHQEFRVLSLKSGDTPQSDIYQTMTHSGPALPGPIWSNVYLLDADGDGAPDLLTCTPIQGSGTWTYLWERRMHDHVQGFSDTVTVVTSNGPPCAEATVVDVDGDNTQELLLNFVPMVQQYFEGIPTFEVPANPDEPVRTGVMWPMTGAITNILPAAPAKTERLVLDTNGDGLVDVVDFTDVSGVPGSLKARIWTNKGAGFVSDDSDISRGGGPCESQGKFDLGQSAVVLDENGDGRSDLVVRCGSKWVVLKSLGSGFNLEALDEDVAQSQDQLFSYDEDNDGLKDLANLGSVFHRSGTPRERLAAVTDGMGARIEVEYSSLAKSETNGGVPLYQQAETPVSCGYPTYCKHPQSLVVRAHKIWAQAYLADLPETNTFWYGYRDAASDLSGRGDLGFDTRTVVDNLRNEAAAALQGKHEITLRYDNKRRDEVTGLYPFAGRTWAELDSVTVAPGRIRESGFRREQPQLLRPASRSLFAYFKAETNAVIEKESDSAVFLKNVIYVRDYDTLGNLTSSATYWADQWDGKAQDDVQVTMTYALDLQHLNEWLIRSPRRITVSMHGERNSTRVQRFVYAEDPGEGSGLFPLTGEPEAVIDQPDDPQQSLTRRMVYDAYGNVVASTMTGDTISPESSRTTTVEYDAFHMFPVAETLPDGHRIEVDYDQGLGRAIATSETGRLNEAVTRFEIPDGFGRIRHVIAADGSTTTASYLSRAADSGGLRVVTQRDGAPTETVELDVLGREVTRSIDGFSAPMDPALVLVSSTKYDPVGMGKPTEISRPHKDGASADSTKIKYDPLGRVTQLTFPDQKLIERCYRRNVVCSRDPRSVTTCTVFDEHGREAHRVEPAPTAQTLSCVEVATSVAATFPSESNAANSGSYVTKRFHYYPSGYLLSIVDADGHEVRFDRDDRGNVTTSSSADSGDWQRRYNAFNELEHETSPTGVETEFRYDVLGRLKSRTDLGTGFGGANEVTSFSFDEGASEGFHGKLSETVSADGIATRFRYDPFGRLKKLERTIPASNNNEPLVRNTTYDQYGRPEQVSYEYDATSSIGALSYRYNYTAAGYLLGITRPNPTNPTLDTNIWTATEADDFGQLTGASFGNGVGTQIGYEEHTGRLRSLTNSLGSTKVQDLAFTYYDDGTLHTQTNRALSTATVSVYDYDALKRLTTATTHAGTETGQVLSEEGYQYANDGNIVQRRWTEAGGAPSRIWNFVYDAARPHAVDHICDGPTDPECAAQPDEKILYWAEGSLRSRAGSLRPALSIDNDARHQPRRITGAVGEVWFNYDATGTRVRKSAPDAVTVYLDEQYSRRQASGTSGFEEHLLISAGSTVVAELVRGPAAAAPEISYLHTDHLGSVEAVTNAAGAVVGHRDYEAFGSRRSIAGAATAPLRADFTGHELDSELGLINMKARLYDPQLGRFLSPDPVLANPLSTQGSNPYSYAENSPTNLTDPTGLCADDQGSGDQTCKEGGTGDLPLPWEVVAIKSIADGTFGTKVKQLLNWLGFGSKPTPPQPTVRPLPTFAPATAVDARREVTSIGPTQTPGWSAHQLEVLQAEAEQRASMVPNRLLGDTAPLVDQSHEMFRTAADLLFIVEGGAGLLKFGAGLVKRGIAAIPRLGKTAASAVSRRADAVLPKTLARVIPGDVKAATLGRPGTEDVFVTAAEDIAGMNPAEIARRLAIPESESFTVIEFATPAEGLASPVFRTNPGFVGRGVTGGGAREFVIPNGPIPADAVIKVVGP